MAIAIEEIISNDQVKARWNEPRLSEAFNRRSVGMNPPGPYYGYDPVPGGDIILDLDVDGTFGESKAIVETNHESGPIYITEVFHQMTQSIGFSAIHRGNTYRVFLYVSYMPLSTTVASFRIVDVTDVAELALPWVSDSIVLCDVTIPVAGDITSSDISLGLRRVPWENMYDYMLPWTPLVAKDLRGMRSSIDGTGKIYRNMIESHFGAWSVEFNNVGLASNYLVLIRQFAPETGKRISVDFWCKSGFLAGSGGVANAGVKIEFNRQDGSLISREEVKIDIGVYNWTNFHRMITVPDESYEGIIFVGIYDTPGATDRIWFDGVRIATDSHFKYPSNDVRGEGIEELVFSQFIGFGDQQDISQWSLQAGVNSLTLSPAGKNYSSMDRQVMLNREYLSGGVIRPTGYKAAFLLLDCAHSESTDTDQGERIYRDMLPAFQCFIERATIVAGALGGTVTPEYQSNITSVQLGPANKCGPITFNVSSYVVSHMGAHPVYHVDLVGAAPGDVQNLTKYVVWDAVNRKFKVYVIDDVGAAAIAGISLTVYYSG